MTMSTIPGPLSEEHGSMFESHGPHFFSRISKEEGNESRSDAPDAALCETYQIELSKNGLGINGIVFTGLRACADVSTTELFDSDNLEEGQRTNIGSATISMIETRFQEPERVYRSCKIEQLDFEFENILIKMEAFAVTLRRIQSFCVEHQAEHLAMAPIQGSCWFSGLLKPAGFNLCDCERLDRPVGVGFQLCMVLPTPPIESPTRINEDSPMDDTAVSESDEVAAAAKDRFARELSSIGDQYNRLMEKMQKEAKVLGFQQVPAEGRVFSIATTNIGRIDEIRRTQYSGGKDVLAPISNGKTRASPSAGTASIAPPHRNMINQTRAIALTENRANTAAADMKREDPLFIAALTSTMVQQRQIVGVGSSNSQTADKPANKAGGQPGQDSGALAEGSPFEKPSLPQRQGIVTSPAASEEATGPEGSTPGPLSKKRYCTYWIRKGECDYMQEGCRYKHEMPVDEETQQRIGLREIPLWFRESPEYEQFLQKVQHRRSATGTLTDVGSDKKNPFTARSSRRGSGRSGNDISSHGGRGTATTRRDPVKMGSYTVQSPHENFHQSAMASSTEAKTACAGPPSASKIKDTQAVNATTNWRSNKESYKPSKAIASSCGSDIRTATKENAIFKDSNIEESRKGYAENRGGSRYRASSTHSVASEGGVPLSRSATDSAPSMLPGRTKRESSSPFSDASAQKARPGLEGAKMGRKNSQARN